MSKRFCDNQPCVNPAHLQLGTIKDNSQDMMNKGRGGGQFKPKLSDADVREIRRLHQTHTLKQIAKIFNVSEGQICHISTGRSRSDVA